MSPSAPRSVSELILRIAELERALAPFARIAEVYDWRPPESRLLSSPLGDIKVCDLQRAAQVLEQ